MSGYKVIVGLSVLVSGVVALSPFIIDRMSLNDNIEEVSAALTDNKSYKASSYPTRTFQGCSYETVLNDKISVKFVNDIAGAKFLVNSQNFTGSVCSKRRGGTDVSVSALSDSKIVRYGMELSIDERGEVTKASRYTDLFCNVSPAELGPAEKKVLTDQVKSIEDFMQSYSCSEPVGKLMKTEAKLLKLAF